MEKTTEQQKPVRGVLMTIQEGAKYIGQGKTWLQDRVRNRQIPAFEPDPVLGGGWRVDSAVLDDILRKRMTCKEAL